MRFAVRLDRDEVDDDGDTLANSVAATLSAPEAYQPEQMIGDAQEIEARESYLDARYAEAIAYVRVLNHFDSDKKALAKYLAIATSALESRLRRAERSCRGAAVDI